MSKLLLFLTLVVGCHALRGLRDPVVKGEFHRKLNPKMFSSDATVPYKTDYFNAKVDQFSFSETTTYKMKYLYNMDSYKSGGPVFFYTGNEGSVETFAAATGIMFDLAPMFNAAIVFTEHRFYGTSQPFVNSTISYENIPHLGYLTSQQALADYAQFLTELKRPNNTLKISFPAETKVIAFGGSYGGMLSAWMRMKYPHLVDGAWASSAPLLYFRGANVPEGAFDHITTRTYQKSNCNIFMIANSWNAMRNMSKTEDGRKKLDDLFNLDPPLSDSNTVDNLIAYVREGIEYMAMTDYPYPTTFLMPLPADPVIQACTYLNQNGTNFTDLQLVTAMSQAVSVYYNTTITGKKNCIDPNICGDQGTGSLGDSLGWPWQECSELIMDMCAQGMPNDFFMNECSTDNFVQLREGCEDIFKSLNWTNKVWNIDAVRQIYGFSMKDASNIILTQGSLDPWSGGGYASNSKSVSQSRGIYAFEIPYAAHHLDLRTPNSCDPAPVTNARYQIVAILRAFIYDNIPLPVLKDLPKYQAQSKANCQYIKEKYPWGQTDSAAASLSIMGLIITFLLH